ncbi:hypothetical protein AYO44_01690 [Planctomycetaceae bacterium SCGC AG-212-F19]|nr:hypothetical protein AYO44_01690 [Planctomycetaceae bacterium SCGC AG-212-F19]
MTEPTRRSFNAQMLASLMTCGLVETLVARHLLADEVKPIIHKWMVDLNQLGQDVKDRKIKDVEWQAKVEELYKQVDLATLVQLVNLDRVEKTVRYPDKGAANLGIDLTKVEGLPQRLVFGKQIFACAKGRSIVPHGHDNMCTGFIVLKGTWVGKHYDRVQDNADHYLIKPTIDRTFKPGECSTISDHKDNVHWFKADADAAFVFNIHIMGYNPDNKRSASRVYVDPEGEKTADGLIVAKKITSAECHRKYG